jgi:hypothetical protein
VKLLLSQVGKKSAKESLGLSEDIAFLDWGIALQVLKSVPDKVSLFPVKFDSPASAGFFVPYGDHQFMEMIEHSIAGAFGEDNEWNIEFRRKMEQFGVELSDRPPERGQTKNQKTKPTIQKGRK